MADVHTDLVTEADALANLIQEREGTLLLPTSRAVVRQLAELTVLARRVVLSLDGVDSTPAPEITASGLLGDVVQDWLAEHRKAAKLLAEADEDVPWRNGELRPSVVSAALLTALFARGQDIADTLGSRLERNDSIGHVAYYGVRTRDEPYLRHGRTPPAEPFRFELIAPSGIKWEFGPADAAERVSGPAEDFCLLVTGRRPRAELAVHATGTLAPEWTDLANSAPDPLWTSTTD